MAALSNSHNVVSVVDLKTAVLILCPKLCEKTPFSCWSGREEKKKRKKRREKERKKKEKRKREGKEREGKREKKKGGKEK